MEKKTVLSSRFYSKLLRILNQKQQPKQLINNYFDDDSYDTINRKQFREQHGPDNPIQIKVTYNDPNLGNKLVRLLEQHDETFTHIKSRREIYFRLKARQIIELSYKKGIESIEDDSKITLELNFNTSKLS